MSLPPPTIPVGTTTKVGLGSAALLAAIAAVSALLEGDHSPATITALITAVGTLITVLGGRYAQAYAMYRDTLSPQQIASIQVPDMPAKNVLDPVGVPIAEAEIQAITEQAKAAAPAPAPLKRPTTERSKRPHA